MAARCSSPTNGEVAARPRCRSYDRMDWGANAFYDIVDGKLEFRSHYKLPAPQLEQENCVAHNGSVIPVPGRDIFVQAWYQGGVSVIDFTDSTRPSLRSATSTVVRSIPKRWCSAATGRPIGTTGKSTALRSRADFDVFALVPSDHLSANEIKAAALANQGRVFNPQQQFQVTWPHEPVVALAYLDQLERSEVVTGCLCSGSRGRRCRLLKPFFPAVTRAQKSQKSWTRWRPP